MKVFFNPTLMKSFVVGSIVVGLIGLGILWFKHDLLIDKTGSLTLKGRLAYSLPFDIQRELIENNKLLQEHSSVSKTLKELFDDVNVRKAFVDRYKEPLIAPIVSAGDRMTSKKKQLLEKHEKQYMTQAKKVVLVPEELSGLLQALANKYELTFYPSSSFVIASPLWDEFVVKIAKHRWIDNNEMVAFPYQLISRIFYNKKIRAFLEREKLKYVMVPRKYLYHIPGTSNELHDDNYLIIEEKIKKISDQKAIGDLKEMVNQQSIKIFEELKNLWSGGDDSKTTVLLTKLEQELALPSCLIELIRVIRFAGLWSMSAHGSLSIGILNDGRIVVNDGRMAIMDTERPGLGGGLSRWEYFFHKNEQEVIKLASCGLGELINLLK